jgi:hypothetical protein
MVYVTHSLRSKVSVFVWQGYPVFQYLYTPIRSRRSSGSIVSDYGLDYQAAEVRSPAETKDFSSNLCVQTGSGAHPASCTMGTGGPFHGGKARPGRDADHLPHLVPRSRMSGSYTSFPPCHLHGGSGTALPSCTLLGSLPKWDVLETG